MLNNILDKNYILLFIANISIFYAFMMFNISTIYDIDIRTGLYLAIGALAGQQSITRNINIKEKTQKSILYSLIVLIVAFLMHIYFFDKYNIEILNPKNWQFLIMFVIFIGVEIYYYLNTAEYIKNMGDKSLFK